MGTARKCPQCGASFLEVDDEDLCPKCLAKVVFGPRPASPWPPHGSPVIDLGFHADGSRIVSASADFIAEVWDTLTLAPRASEMKHRGPVLWATFSPDGKLVATASADETARVWEAATGQPVTPPLRHETAVAEVHFSPNGQQLLTMAGNSVFVWNLVEDRRPFKTLISWARLMAARTERSIPQGPSRGRPVLEQFP